MDLITNLFKGRANRRTFFIGVISSALLQVVVALLLGLLFPEETPDFVNTLYTVLAVAVLVFNISLFVRRWHDLGNTGWLVLLNLVPLVNIFAALYAMFKSGQDKSNKYGPKPKDIIQFPYDILGLK